MHRITSIDTRKRHLARVCFSPAPNLSALLEERHAFLPELENGHPLIDRTILERLNLTVGDTLSPEDVLELLKTSLCFRAKEKAIWYLASSDRSARSLHQKLSATFGTFAAQFAVEQMQLRGYLNDEAYAMRLAQALNNQGLSARAAQQKMQQKGLGRELTVEAIARYFDEDEVTKAKKLLLSKYAAKLDCAENIRKVTAALQRRGFSFNTIRAALTAVQAEVEETAFF